jgi:hypothetical protein
MDVPFCAKGPQAGQIGSTTASVRSRLALYGSPQPLHLPFGLTGHHAATVIAAALILMSFLFVATGTGSIVRRNSP